MKWCFWYSGLKMLDANESSHFVQKVNTSEVGIRSTLVPIGTSEIKILGTGYWPDFQYADLWTTQMIMTRWKFGSDIYSSSPWRITSELTKKVRKTFSVAFSWILIASKCWTWRIPFGSMRNETCVEVLQGPRTALRKLVWYLSSISCEQRKADSLLTKINNLLHLESQRIYAFTHLTVPWNRSELLQLFLWK